MDNALSGIIDILEGMANYGFYGMGNREVGHFYKVLNFHPIQGLA